MSVSPERTILLTNTRCGSCYYGDACVSDGMCPFYDRVFDTEDAEIDTYIERAREEYRDLYYGEWVACLFADEFSNAD